MANTTQAVASLTSGPSHSELLSVDDMSDDDLDQLLSHAKDYMITHGALLKLVAFEEPTGVPARPVAASALPTPYPRRQFHEALELQQAMCELYMRAANDQDWLYKVMKPLIQHDELLSALWSVHVRVMRAGAVQNICCGIFRSDYMLHQTPDGLQLKQVEMNTFSAAGACHAEKVAKMHRRLRHVHIAATSMTLQDLPDSNNLHSIVTCLKTAHSLYTASTSQPTCILMVVQPFNFNIADERPIEYGLWDANVPCYRCNWPEIMERTTLTEDRTLLFRPGLGTVEFEVTVVYYRAGYDPREYNEGGQVIRSTLELSKAIKCPDVLTHLTTFKTVQQALTESDVVERFLPSVSAGKLRETFMPLLALDTSSAGLDARKIAMSPKEAMNYVLKPNLEGGGHNIYRSDIPRFLSSVPQEQWHTYILMRLIESPAQTKGVLMTHEELYQGPVVSELGVLGACIWRRKDVDDGGGVAVLRNEVAGWTFKTKPSDIDEMSVVKGYGCFDCPLLMD